MQLLSRTAVRYFTHAILALGALATLAFMLVMAGGLDFVLSPFTVWALLPYAVLALPAHLSRTPLFGRAFAIASVLVVGFALALYGAALSSSDGQAAFVFIFVPPLQLIAILATAILAALIRLAQRLLSRTTQPAPAASPT